MAQRGFSLFRSCRLLSLPRSLHRGLQQHRKTMYPSITHQTITESNQSSRSFCTSVPQCAPSAVNIDVPLQDDDVSPMLDDDYYRETIIPFGAGVDILIGPNYVRFCSHGNAPSEADSNPPDPDPDFSFLIDDDPKNIKILRPVAIRRGTPDDNNDVWIVHQEEDDEIWGNKKRWKDISNIPLKDPDGVLESQLYQVHLAQVLYATSSVEWRKDVPFKRETLSHENMPYATTSDEANAPMSVRQLRNFSKSQWNHCQNIQLAILQNWRNTRGRLALEALMKKADYVCSDAAFDVFGASKEEVTMKPTMVDNVGGGEWFDGGCVLSTAILKPGKLDGPEKREILKADETWKKLDFVPWQYTPDFYFKSLSKQSAISCVMGEVKSDQLTAWDEQQMWNQSTIGLKDKNKTCAVYITPREAGILTIQLEGDTVKTYKREYPLEVDEDESLLVIDPNQIEKFFSDLVLTIWENAYNEAS